MRRTRLMTRFEPAPKLSHSDIYKEALAEREEVLKHKWLESEKVGYDIGYDRALVDWIMNHREKWRSFRRANKSA